MAFDAHKNFAYSTVLTAPSPASSGTSLVVQSGDGAKFPAVSFNATIWPAGVQPTTTNAEVVRVTARSTDTLTITRAQESSSARTVVVGDQIAATITAKTFTDIETADLSQFGSTTSAQLATVLSDETGTGVAVFGTSPGFTTAANPASSDGAALGTTALQWSDLFLASGGVINFSNGDYTMTHSSGILTANKDLRVTTVGTNTASVVTVGGTQTLTNKTLTTAALGSSTATTQAVEDNSTKVATTAYVDKGALWDAYVSTASNITTTATTATDVTGFTFSLTTTVRYEFEVLGLMSSDTSAGLKVAIGFTGGGSPTISYVQSGHTSSTTIITEHRASFSSLSSAFSLGVSLSSTIWMRGSVYAGNPGGGNLTLQFAKVTSGTAYILGGTIMRVRAIG